MHYTIVILIACDVALAWMASDYFAEVKRLERVTAINVQTIARLKADPQTRLNDAFRHYPFLRLTITVHCVYKLIGGAVRNTV